MGTYTRPPYKRLNRETNTWEWVKPSPVEFTSEKGVYEPVDVKPKKKKKK